jgi:hypothetical protein
MGASEPQRAPPRQADPPRRSEERPALVHQLFDGSDRPDSESLQRHRLRAKSTNSASTPSAPQETEFGAAPRCLQSLLIQGGGASDVHVFLVTGNRVHVRRHVDPGQHHGDCVSVASRQGCWRLSAPATSEAAEGVLEEPVAGTESAVVMSLPSPAMEGTGAPLPEPADGAEAAPAATVVNVAEDAVGGVGSSSPQSIAATVEEVLVPASPARPLKSASPLRARQGLPPRRSKRPRRARA